MSEFDATVIEDGRITIPDATRKILDIEKGDVVHVRIEKRPLKK